MDMYMQSFMVVGILLYLNILATVSCLDEIKDVWTPYQPGYQLTDMLLSTNGGHVVVSGTNMVYSINASNLELLNFARTGPYNASVDDTVKLMVRNHSYTGVEYLVTCSSTHNNCLVRNMTNIAHIDRSLEQWKYVNKINGVQAFIVDNLRESGTDTEHDSYLFVGCPHFKYQHRFEGLCKKPGIFWYKDSGAEENDGVSQQGFKEKAEVKTEKFVAAFPVEKLRMFFSIQKHKNGSKMSRIAQVCQHYHSRYEAYTTPLTYVDMPITCGELHEVLDVKKVTVDGSVILVAVFTDNMKSAVCVYNMSHVNKTFVDNVKKCYTTVWPPYPIPGWYYFRYAYHYIPCRPTWPQSVPLPTNDEDFLCNKYRILAFHHMIGDTELSKDPIIILNKTVTSLTTTTLETNVIAFFGTTDCVILKAQVYPESTARVINHPDMYIYGSHIKTLLTSHKQEHLFVLTEHKLYKVPVESCADFQSCGECLGSRDPYCGWCMLENRCSINATCPATDVWVPSLNTDSQCPYLLKLEPSVMSGKDTHMLEIKISHKIQAVNISCAFDFEQFTRNYTSPARLINDDFTITCNTTFIPEELNTVQGSINVTVSIVTPVSDRPIVHSNLTVYNCETFYSCSQCTAIDDACLWNTYDVNCVDNAKSSNTTVNEQKMCPRVYKYTVTAADGTMLDHVDGSWYLSGIGGHFNITMTGTNLPSAGTISYYCKMSIGSSQTTRFIGTRVSPDEVICEIKMDKDQVLPPYNDQHGTIQFMRGSSAIAGNPLIAVIYACRKASDTCGLCKSFDLYQSHYQCKWCGSACVYKQTICDVTDMACPNPVITHVYPLSAAVNAPGVEIEIEGKNLGSKYSDTINAVTVAGRKCESLEELYDPGKRIVCTLEGSYTIDNGKVRVTLNNGASGEYFDTFSFRLPVIKWVEPVLGPSAGGTLITLHGDFLDTGKQRQVLVDGMNCSEASTEVFRITSPSLLCKTPARNVSDGNSTVSVSIDYDGVMVHGGDDIDFTYVPNPYITDISPLESFLSGGRNLTVYGINMYSIQKPKIYADHDGIRTDYQNCTRIGSDELICPSPRYDHHGYISHDNHTTKNSDTKKLKLGFIMDNVSGVLAENIPDNIAVIHYYPDPVVYNLTKTRNFKEIQENSLIIRGNALDSAANKEDVIVQIGCIQCNLVAFTTDTILCKPPPDIPDCIDPNIHAFAVQVQIGYFKRSVGVIRNTPKEQIHPPNSSDKYIIGTVIGVLVLCFIFAGIFVGAIKKNTKRAMGIELDKLEANFRNQNREALSDLMRDLEGWSVLFRDYSMYATKTLFTSQNTNTLTQPLIGQSKQTEKAMEKFKKLLLNSQFMSMFIKTLEKQTSFTKYDTSNVATILMTLNLDNLEYMTGILTHLLNDLVDKNIDSGNPKLMLGRSESVAETLLTHWLSICLYHHLKGKPGSSLYILYKAIKIQTEKGPIDYMANCAKYTLSEDKLFPLGDRDINHVTLALRVNHFDYVDNMEKQVTVNVLDCDTITQTKSKMLDILYKNVPYSQRPSVLSTTLAVHKSSIGRTLDEVSEVQSDDSGLRRYLNDEDASSVRDGPWTRINTLQHYKVKDGATVFLYLKRDLNQSSFEKDYPASNVVGTFQKSVKTTKGHKTDEDVQLGSDVFLPMLATTKMTIQTYIEQLFTSLLSVDDEPSIIIKYLFDFLDVAASRCGVTDPDVVHTWKCNSLLLRFWVNIIKNPEIVFDVHKPLLVDSCLSVVAQTLMNSCSTDDLVLNKSSPSNKLLFAKEIPRYKAMVKDYLQTIKEKPAVNDHELNSYLTQKVSQNFSGAFPTQSALMQMFDYAEAYKTELCLAMDQLEDLSPGVYSPLSSKLQNIFCIMERVNR